MELTEIDRNILGSYKKMINGLAEYLGDSYEFVLHSLEDLDESVIKIINGHHSNRKIGAPITDLALAMLSEIEDKLTSDAITYYSKNRFGNPLKATTIKIYGENQRVIGLLCINLYLNTSIYSFMGDIMNAKAFHNIIQEEEYLAEDTDDLLNKAVEKAKLEAENDPAILSSMRNKKIILQLYNQGLFKLKDSVNKVSELLGISSNTTYLHLRNIKDGERKKKV